MGDPVNRETIAARLLDVVELVNEQRWKVHEMRTLARAIAKMHKRVETIVQKLDDAEVTPVLIAEALYELEVWSFDMDSISEALFDGRSLKPLAVEATVEAILTEAEREP